MTNEATNTAPATAAPATAAPSTAPSTAPTPQKWAWIFIHAQHPDWVRSFVAPDKDAAIAAFKKNVKTKGDWYLSAKREVYSV